MGDIIVSKFGGSSLANGEQIKKVAKIIGDDPRRKIVVVSAPGKGPGDDEKMTDHLINIATEGKHFLKQGKLIPEQTSRQAVKAKFTSIISDLGIDGGDILSDLEADLRKEISQGKKIDFYASRGEYYNSLIISKYLNQQGLKAKPALPEKIGLVVTDNFENARVMPRSYKDIKINLLSNPDNEIQIVPGFYGITDRGDIAVFSRGGSDLTGGEIAYAVDACLYENWTDRDGIYQVDPRIIPHSQIIPRLTYKEIRLLSSKGFNVFHYDAMVKCSKKSIPINIKNTNNPSAQGTLIVSNRPPKEIVVGIGHLNNLAYLYMEKSGSGVTIAVISQLLKIMKNFGIQTYHYPMDKDDISVIVNQEDLLDCEEELLDTVRAELRPDILEINHDIAILSPVGMGMKGHPGIIAEASLAMKKNNINIEILDQGPAQVSFHFGIRSEKSTLGLEALYESLIIGSFPKACSK